MIRTVIGSVFLHRFLTMLGYHKEARVTFFIYLIVILSFDAFLTIDIFLKDGISCDGKNDWQIFTLLSIDTLQAILLIVTVFIMHRNTELKKRTESVLTFSQSSRDPNNRFQVQMNSLSYFYVISTCMDWALFISGRFAVQNQDILCYNEMILLVNSNLGGLYMLFLAVASYIYAFVMWYVFY